MDMLIIPIFAFIFLLTLWLTSHIAKQLHADRPAMPWILLSWVVGAIAAFAALVMLDVLQLGLDDPIKLGLQVFLPVFLIVLAYAMFNGLSAGSALTTGIAALFMGLIFSVVAIVVTGKPLDKTIQYSQLTMQNAKQQAVAMITGKKAELVDIDKEMSPQEEVAKYDEPEPVYTSRQLLSDKAQKALDRQEAKGLPSHRYRNIAVYNARRAVGMQIRMSRTDGKVASGKLEEVRGGDLIVIVRRREGAARVPVAMSDLAKLEVYR